MDRRRFIGAGALALVAGLAGCSSFSVRSSQSVEESVPAAGVERVRVTNAVGHVSVVGRDTDRIEYRAVKRVRGDDADFDRLTVTAARNDGLFELTGGYSGSASVFEDRGSIELELTVPSELVVEAVTLDVGDVSLRDTTGDTLVRVGVGGIEARGVDGFLDLTTQTGDIEATDIAGLDRASTDIGDVAVELRQLRGDVDVHADVGRVAVRVRSDLDLDIELTGSSVESDLVLGDERRERDRITGRLNAGGHRLRVGVDVGEATVRAL